MGNFKANHFGLYDMLGNVWEWCEDAYSEDAYAKHNANNPIFEGSGASFRVLRGGSWSSIPRDVRSASRSRDSLGDSNVDAGFRVLRAK